MKQLMLGNEAVARGAYEAGIRVATAYPGTPSTEITENIAKYDGIYSEWAPNEKVAVEVAIGASLGGARAIVSMKHVGVNVAADPLFTAAYTGVNGGLIVAVADDPGMHSSQNEQDSRYYARSAHIPMLEPSDSQEAKDMTALAAELSEKYDTPVFLRLTTRVSHSQSVVEPGEPISAGLKPYQKDFQKNVMMPAMAKKRHVVLEERMARIAADADTLPVNRIEMGADTSVGIITSGIVYQYAKEAMQDACFFKLGMVHPLPRKRIGEFAKKVSRLIALEELEPVIEEQIRSWGIAVEGKSLFTRQGEYSVAMIRRALGKEAAEPKPETLPVRPPVMCPGCPHRGVYYAMNRLKLGAMGDIGCYTLGALPPLSAIESCVCMGASIGMAHGIGKAMGPEQSEKMVAVIGDSTFFHSGITGLIDVVYNGGFATVVILDNRTTGMTGHQNHPGTGKNIKGDPAPMIDIEALVRSIGVTDIQTVDPFDIQGTMAALKRAVSAKAPSVVIAKRACALLDRKAAKPALTIDMEKCRQCGVCLKLGCPAIQKKDTGMVIDSALCVGCGLCATVCAFGAIGGTDHE